MTRSQFLKSLAGVPAAAVAGKIVPAVEATAPVAGPAFKIIPLDVPVDPILLGRWLGIKKTQDLDMMFGENRSLERIWS